MKKIACFLILLPLLISCSQDSKKRNVNPYIPDYSFTVSLDTNLPSYTQLTIPFNPVLVTINGAGVKGLVVMKISDGDYRAWEANCPNQYPSDCSMLAIKNSTTLRCPCDDLEYSIITGVGGGQYTLKPYATEISGTVIRVYN